ncbi:hypothetical protein CAPTEDRAFT_107051, partial [Capitella teleta]
RCTDVSYQCQDGKCISMTQYCDFHDDCDDRSDEINCYRPPCNMSNEWMCSNAQCIAIEKRCDLLVDCVDSSDELKCGDWPCPTEFLKCPSSFCIPPQMVCNGLDDCLNGEDEIDCGQYACMIAKFFIIIWSYHNQQINITALAFTSAVVPRYVHI